ncbi:tyrosine-type recombinase/integrase [Calidithermus chliarophilus]|uniref:tyrosine-type recombinase/integrase n=1 Tax=Calidithermus chliarophilus TaxID=52023 RepID=UPI00041DE17F|nr:tyrosine-type recombinase/integrase [Calidithermus chliarophilus]
MSRGGYRPQAYPWGQVLPERRAERVRAFLEADDRAALWALLRHHLTTWGRAGERTSRATLKTYRSGLEAFFGFLLAQGLTDPARRAQAVLEPPEDFGAQFVRWLERRHRPATVNARRAAVRAFYRALRWARATQADPLADVPSVRDPIPPEAKRHPYTPAEVERLLERATPHERAMVLLGAHGGLRASEIMGLEWAAVDLEGEALRVRGKGSKVRLVPLSDALRGALEALPRGEGRVLPWRQTDSLRRRLRRLCERAGVEYKGAHSLRHHAGTRVYRATRDLRLAQEFLGHSAIATTAIYAKMDREHLTNAVKEAFR